MGVETRTEQRRAELAKAIETGAGVEYGLELSHLARAESIRLNDDGTLTFDVERHPHLLRHVSKGKLSSAFTRVLETYRFSPPEEVSLVQSRELERVLDIGLLAIELVEPGFYDLFSPEDLLGVKGSEAKARHIASQISWFEPGQVEGLHDDEVEQLREECIELAVKKLLATT
jgi:hypothetical protein